MPRTTKQLDVVFASNPLSDATADYLAAPVSTTHILSSGIAGTMAANKSGLQAKTVRNILIAWVLTLPVTIVLSGLLFWITAGKYIVK